MAIYDSNGKPLPVSHVMYKDFLDAVTPEKVDFSYLTLQVLAKQTGGGWLETSSNLAVISANRWNKRIPSIR